jgi:hypothetical protein
MFDARSIKDDGQKNSAQGNFIEKNRGILYGGFKDRGFRCSE